MDFVIQWLSYLLAFVAGSALAWGVALPFIKRGAAKAAAEAEGGVR